ncbi:KCNIP3 (predicted) [Pycnogonum litorale]
MDLLRRRSSAGRHIHHHQRFREQYTLETLCLGTHFTKREIQSMYRGFKQHCPNGVLGVNRMKDIYAQLFPQGNAAAYANLVFQTLDQNRNGHLNFGEYLIMLSSMSRGSVNEKLHWIFNLYDVDRDGYVSTTDMYDLLSAIYQMVNHYCPSSTRASTSRASTSTPLGTNIKVLEHVQRVFSKFDTNKDGLITRDKFMEKCLKDETITRSLNVFDTVV